MWLLSIIKMKRRQINEEGILLWDERGCISFHTKPCREILFLWTSQALIICLYNAIRTKTPSLFIFKSLSRLQEDVEVDGWHSTYKTNRSTDSLENKEESLDLSLFHYWWHLGLSLKFWNFWNFEIFLKITIYLYSTLLRTNFNITVCKYNYFKIFQIYQHIKTKPS